MAKKLKAYRFPLILLSSIIVGSIIGLIFGEKASVIKPFGDLFLNLLFMIVVPLVFFSIASAVANMDSMKRLGKIMGSMLSIFIITGIIASITMLVAVVIFPVGSGVNIPIEVVENTEMLSLSDQLVNTFTVPDFVNLFSRKHMLALIVFSVLLGIATGLTGEAGKPFARFLESGSEIFMKVIQLVMYYAPIGLGAYFAALIGDFGGELIGDYAQAFILYYPVAFLYFAIGFTLYAFIAGGKKELLVFGKTSLRQLQLHLALEVVLRRSLSTYKQRNKLAYQRIYGKPFYRSVRQFIWMDLVFLPFSKLHSSSECSIWISQDSALS